MLLDRRRAMVRASGGEMGWSAEVWRWCVDEDLGRAPSAFVVHPRTSADRCMQGSPPYLCCPCIWLERPVDDGGGDTTLSCPPSCFGSGLSSDSGRDPGSAKRGEGCASEKERALGDFASDCGGIGCRVAVVGDGTGMLEAKAWKEGALIWARASCFLGARGGVVVDCRGAVA